MVFWCFIQTHTECIPKKLVNTHHLGLKEQNLENFTFTWRYSCLKRGYRPRGLHNINVFYVYKFLAMLTTSFLSWHDSWIFITLIKLFNQFNCFWTCGVYFSLYLVLPIFPFLSVVAATVLLYIQLLQIHMLFTFLLQELGTKVKSCNFDLLFLASFTFSF